MSTVLIIPLGGLKAGEVQRLQSALTLARRNAEIRARYPALRDAVGQLEAIAQLSETFYLSERQVKRILWE